MAPVDLNRNKDSIIKAHKEVSDPASKTNWALFGYEGQTDVLKLVSKGDGGVEEMTEDLSSGKMMYAYLKIMDPNTALPKFVFINWQGEGVPEVRKGSCASHVRDVQNLLRGAHVSINARTEDDISEDIITSKVSKASGANYSFHKEERRPMPAIGPVGSVYEKVRPQVEIKPDIREKFWENSEKEEKQRILLEKQRLQQEKNKLEKEAKEREEKEAKAREQREAERLKHICEIREAEKKAGGNDKASDNGHWNEDDAKHDEDERAKRSDQMRKERAAEAKSLAASRTAGARNMFEQKPTSQFDQPSKAPPPARKLKQPAFLENQPDEPAQRKQPIQLPKGSPSPESPKSPPAAAPPRAPAAAPPRAPAAVPPSRPAVQPEPEELYEDVTPVSQESESLYEDAESFQRQDLQPQPAPEAPHVRNLLAEGVPRRPPSDDEEDDDQNWDDDAPSKVSAAPPAPPARNPEPQPEPEEELYQDTGNVVSDTGYGDEELYQDTGNVSSGGVCARALYDYQAAEDNELTFDPDEIISDIEMVDEGWWIGTRQDGSRGMFPSNYVELI